MKRKLFSLAIAVAMLLTLIPGVALAAGSYSIADGDITVAVDASGKQTVNETEDNSPVITGTSTGNTVSIVVADGQTANVTFKDLSITTAKSGGNYNIPVTITGSSNGTVIITVEGNNNFINDQTAFSSQVNTVIKGSGTLDLNVTNEETNGNVACVDMYGSSGESLKLTIEGEAKVNVSASSTIVTGIRMWDGIITVKDTASLKIDSKAKSDTNEAKSNGMTEVWSVTVLNSASLSVNAAGESKLASSVTGLEASDIKIEDSAKVSVKANGKSDNKESSVFGINVLDSLTAEDDSSVKVEAEANSQGENNYAMAVGINGEDAALIVSDTADIEVSAETTSKTENMNVSLGLQANKVNVSDQGSLAAETTGGNQSKSITVEEIIVDNEDVTEEYNDKMQSGSLTIAPAPSTDNPTTDNKPSSGSGIKVTYNGGNSFSTSKSAVPTSVEIDGVAVPFSGDGKSFTVGCIEPNAKWVTVRWNSTSITVNFTPDASVVCAEVMIPKTGDMPIWAGIAAVFGF